jgi:hypothetical protein
VEGGLQWDGLHGYLIQIHLTAASQASGITVCLNRPTRGLNTYRPMNLSFSNITY